MLGLSRDGRAMEAPDGPSPREPSTRKTLALQGSFIRSGRDLNPRPWAKRTVDDSAPLRDSRSVGLPKRK